MFKISFFIRKKPALSQDKFRTYWLGEHAERLSGVVEKLGVRSLVKCEVLPEHPVGVESMAAYQTGRDLYDFVDHWYFNDIDALKRGSADQEVQAAMNAIYASEDPYVDTARSNVMMQVDLAQFYPPDAEGVVATEDSSYVKIIYGVRCLPELNRQQAQLHWNACHGAVSRQDIKYSVMKKYIQAHAIDSTFVNQLMERRGYRVDESFIGAAEGWIDVEKAPKDFPAEEMAEVVAMSMDDIALFVERERSQVFVTKEHVIMDMPVIVRPMPRFFSAVY
jgi:hypothetical protein